MWFHCIIYIHERREIYMKNKNSYEHNFTIKTYINIQILKVR